MRRYELLVDGRLLGEIRYRLAPGVVVLVHTEVAPSAEGQGLGARLVAGALDAAAPDAVAATILTCPTGALQFRRLDGGAQEEPQAEWTIEARPDGPLFVRGRVRIVHEDGRVIREDTRVALCRCGASEGKPFCDGSHRRTGFSTG